MCAELWGPEWLDTFYRVDMKGKVALLVGKGVEYICNRVMGDMESAGWVDDGREGSLLYG